MSWDISICKFSRDYDTIDEIQEGERCYPLGTRFEVQTAISRSFPGTNWSDAVWGVFESPFGSVEFNLGHDDPVESLMLHVSASEEIVHRIVELCRAQHWQALDASDGTFLEKSGAPEAGLQGWQDFRTRALSNEA
jgi:hypothetical protein